MEFLLYIQFVEKVWTLVGGIKSIQASFNNEPVESEDFGKSYRILIPGSGVRSFSLDGSGVLDFQNGTEMLIKLWDLYYSGTDFETKLEGQGVSITGKCILKEFGTNSQYNQANDFSYKLISSGAFEIRSF